MAPPLAVQGCRKTEPDAPSSCCNALVARTIGPISAPILRPVIGSDTPTALSRADVKKRCGLSDLGQCVDNKVTYAMEEGRCISKNLNQAFSKSGPVGCRKEMLWNGLPGSPVNSEFFCEPRKTSQGGQQGSDSGTAGHEITGNGAATAPTIKSLEVMGERKGKHPCKLKMAVQGAAVPIYDESSTEKMVKEGKNESTSAKVMKEGERAPTSAIVEKEGEHDPTILISRVEDSLCASQIEEAYQSPSLLASDETKNKHTHIQCQSGSSLSRISDTYVPFEKPANLGYQLSADDVNNQTIQGNEPLTTNTPATMERRVFWVGESSKNSKREERKNLRSVVSQISNSVSDMGINNCNRLFWLKHGSLETIRVWELGKQLGAICGVESNVMVSLEELEKRDRILKIQREAGENMSYQ